ncbi:hypothetical protein BGZ95_011653 [Linnemannia exigua]|uniref:Uncharacterized protein n=1 Tax=Linnemannia exigua TaxID=604196 RepID=A0AAD4DP61_9FUNG|nr:hypothetical protein BGZ95_011653 [Linnemannia exigua]
MTFLAASDTPVPKDKENDKEAAMRRLSFFTSSEPQTTISQPSPTSPTLTFYSGAANVTRTQTNPTAKKKRVRKPVVKTTPQYMSESDPESELQQRPVQYEQQQEEELAENKTTPLDDQPQDSPSFTPPSSPYVVVLPRSSMLRPKSTTSTVSSSPATSSPTVKQSQTFQSPTPEVRKYTRRRLLLEEEDDDDTELQLELDADMANVSGAAKSPLTTTNEQHSVQRNLALEDNLDGREEEGEPDWIFEGEGPTRKAVWTVESPRADKHASTQSPKKKPARRDKYGYIIRTEKQKPTMKKGKMPLTQATAVAPPAQEDPLFLSNDATSFTRTLTAPPAQEHPIFFSEGRTTIRQLRKNKAPRKPRPAKQFQEAQQQADPELASKQRMDYNLISVGTFRMPANKLRKGVEVVDKKSVHQQHFRFHERNPYRVVDYLHVYDWMSPVAPVRAANNAIQQQIDQLSNKIDLVMFANQTPDRCCTECVGKGLDSEGPQVPGCSKCERVIFDATIEKARLQDRNESIREEILNLRNGRHWLPPTPLHPDCNWCGGFRSRSQKINADVEEQSIDSQVYIKGIGYLPSNYGFDHEHKHLCKSCSDFKERKGVDRETPQVQLRIEELQASIVNHSIDGVIRWDRIANDPRANPNFEFSAHGLLHRLVQYQSKPDQPGISTYILLQQNHLTRKNARSQLYTCQARTPTQAALYFSRFVALYKKHPMTYLYVRKLEAWNIPTPRLDDWEDKASGLQTFEELKQRVRDSALNSKSLTQVEIQQLYEALFPIDPEQTLKRIPPGTNDVWKARLAELIKATMGPENQHLLQQLHFDDEAWNQYLIEWLAPRSHFKTEIRKQKSQAGRDVEDGASTLQEVEGMNTGMDDFDVTSDVMIKERYGLVRSSSGLGLVPLDPPEPRFKQLPKWAQERASQVHRQAIQDERLSHLHERHLFYESVGDRKAELSGDLRLRVEPVPKEKRRSLRALIMREEKERQSVHVYQAILTAETRTVDVRLVRTERYKRQGDCLAGGGPIQIPKIIDRIALRGFYREADRAERYGSALSGGEDKTTIVLRADNNNGKAKGERSGDGSNCLSGVETWKVVEEETMIEMGISDAVINRTNGQKRLQSSLEYAESLGRKPEVLKQRRKEYRRVTGQSRMEVQILDHRLCTVNREVSNATGDAEAARTMAVAVAAEKEKEEKLSEEAPEGSRVSRKDVSEIVEGRVMNEMAAKSGLGALDSLRRLERAKKGTDSSSSSSSSAEELLDRVRRERKRFMDIAQGIDAVLKYKRRKRQEQDKVEWIVGDVDGDQEEVEGLLRIATAAIGEFDASAPVSANRTVAPAESQDQDKNEDEESERDEETDEEDEESRMDEDR